MLMIFKLAGGVEADALAVPFGLDVARWRRGRGRWYRRGGGARERAGQRTLLVQPALRRRPVLDRSGARPDA